jgi:IclR helix-turn-helix domain
LGWVVAKRKLVIALTDVQVTQVMREASGGPTLAGLTGLLAAAGDLDKLRSATIQMVGDPRLSHSALRAILVLAAFPADGSERGLTEVGEALSLPPSTMHRYVRTWVALGLLEQNPRSRRYRQASASTAPLSHVDAQTYDDGR